MKNSLIALVAGAAGLGVGIYEFHHGISEFKIPIEWTRDATLGFFGALIVLAVTLLHVKHSVKELWQRNVLYAVLVIVFSCSIPPFVAGITWLTGGVLLRVTYGMEEHIYLLLGMVWGGGVGTFGGLFALCAFEDRISREVKARRLAELPCLPRAANDNRDPKPQPVKVAPKVAAKPRAPEMPRESNNIYSRPVPRNLLKYVA
ncbi:hypothetical protein [Bradyrhizobium diazoefficiens]|uniref:hypothetical protein n=1 Tax=Bradyrhizobium diazoefficiens TaxID=1355477 RepID=UPI001B66B089|nr:hypothetical protein [Bradyrhizobium japonicum]